MGIFRLPAGAWSRPHFHADCESACCMLSGRMLIRWGDQRWSMLSRLSAAICSTSRRAGTHVLENPSATHDAEYVVARNSPTEDAVEVPWAPR